MPKYKLTYFNIRGLGEPIRYLLSYMGEDFEDVRLLRENWPSIKKTMPFGKVPTLEIDGQIYNDSTAICRYLGNQAGLGGKTPLENLAIDQIIGAIGDLKEEVSKIIRAPDAETKEKNRQTVINEIMPFYLDRVEHVLQANGGYLANGKLSWADLYLVAYSESLPTILEVDPFEKYPQVKALRERVQALPAIKEWIQRRPQSLF